jgi:hypothetical protein
MSKPDNKFAVHADRAEDSSTKATPEVSTTPTVTSSGTLAWNVRDVLFGANRRAKTDINERSHPKYPKG